MKSKFLKLTYLLVIVIIGYSLTHLGNFGPTSPNPVSVNQAGDSVSVLSTGQADSAVISSGGKYCLIDAGSTLSGHTDAVTYLSNWGVTELELVVVTHFHTDHASDIIDVMNNFRINNMVIPNLSQQNMPTTSFFELFLDTAEKRNIKLIPARKGDTYTVGNGVLKILDDTYNDLTVNDTSVATLFTQGEFTFLSTGDGETEYEERLLKVFDSKVTLFVAGHHGSSTSNSKKFIETVRPEFIAFSAGKENEYGHPHREVLKLAEKNKIPYGITFRDGTIVYSITHNKLLTKAGG